MCSGSKIVPLSANLCILDLSLVVGLDGLFVLGPCLRALCVHRRVLSDRHRLRTRWWRHFKLKIHKITRKIKKFIEQTFKIH